MRATKVKDQFQICFGNIVLTTSDGVNFHSESILDHKNDVPDETYLSENTMIEGLNDFSIQRKADYIDAFLFGQKAHKNREDYTRIFHLADIVYNTTHNLDCAITALLIETLREKEVQEVDLRDRFQREIVDAVVALTRRSGESDEDYLKRIKENEIAKLVRRCELTAELD